MLSWFFKKAIKKEIKKEVDYIHHILHNSFNNIKQDISDLHTSHKKLHNSHQEREKKLEEYEKRLLYLENYLLGKAEEKEAKIIYPKLDKEKHIEGVGEALTHTHQKIFVTLYQLQKRLDNHPISIKSLAKIIYPDKKYANVRSTLSEYLAFLSTIGLVSKLRQGKESLAKITDLGLDYIEKLKEQGNLKEKKLKISSKD